MPKPPAPERIRLTISVTPEVHAAFTRMAEASGMSIGRAMGDWLADTVEGATFVTSQLERAREAPRQVIQELRQSTLGLTDAMESLLSDLRAGKVDVPSERSGSPARPTAPSPRPVIRGGKSTPPDRPKGDRHGR